MTDVVEMAQETPDFYLCSRSWHLCNVFDFWRVDLDSSLADYKAQILSGIARNTHLLELSLRLYFSAAQISFQIDHVVIFGHRLGNHIIHIGIHFFMYYVMETAAIAVWYMALAVFRPNGMTL